VRRAEDFPASSATPQQACLAGVRWADAVILILGARYGELQASGLSPTHEEYRESRERCHVLVFVERDVKVEAEQQEFIREVRDWTTGHYTASFSDADDIRDGVTAALRDLELARATGPVDESDMLGRAEALLTEARQRSQALMLTLVVAGGPRQQVLRPRELESPDLEEEITREALFSTFRVFDRTSGTHHSIRGNALEIEQDRASIYIDQLGTVRLIVPAERRRTRGDLASISGIAVHEDIEELLQRGLRLVAWIMDKIDPLRRISDVVPVANVEGALAWRTRAEQERSPNSFPMRMSTEPANVALTPARRHRAALDQDAASIAEDLATLLGRKLRK
jgi:hypothetical protein